MMEKNEAESMPWNELETLVRRLPPKTNLVVPKGATAGPPPYPRSRIGRRRGALRQYRDPLHRRSVHVKEYEDRWVLHVDGFHPARHAVRHLLVDWGYSKFVDLGHLAAYVTPPRRADPVPA